MRYKTLTLELLEARPALYDRLRAGRTLLATLDRQAADLKGRHETLTAAMTGRPHGIDPLSARSAALEIALAELQSRIADADSPTALATEFLGEPASGR